MGSIWYFPFFYLYLYFKTQEMLEIVKYIKAHGLEKTLKDFRLKSKEYDNKVLIKYEQIESPMGERIVQEARGLILEKGTWEVMSLPFYNILNFCEFPFFFNKSNIWKMKLKRYLKVGITIKKLV